jgi:8-oxo-dGTP pyrophosphatase MutT (NUDIX family)
MAKKRVVHYESAGGIVVDGERVLLLDRPARNEVRLPKGHVDPGETAEQAALREVTEESGYADLEIVANLGVAPVEFDFEGKHVVRTEHYFLMRLRSDRTVERDAKDRDQFRIRWAPLADAPALLTFPAEKERAQAAAKWVAGQGE